MNTHNVREAGYSKPTGKVQRYAMSRSDRLELQKAKSQIGHI